MKVSPTLVLVGFALPFLTTACTQTPLERAQERYWTAVLDHLHFNEGLPRQVTVVEVQTRRRQTVQTGWEK